MFDGLNTIPWHDLKHAYGSGEEVPMWLRQLTSDDKRVRESAMNDLWGSICHQGWICPATGYAVPYLVELLEEPSVQDKDEILGLLADIAAAGPLNEETWRRNPRVPTWEVPAHLPFKDAHAEVMKGIPAYLALLDASESKVRMTAAQVLAHLPERKEECRAVLRAAFERESDEVVRANLVLVLGRLAEPVPEAWPFFADIARSSASDLLAFAGALALTTLAKEQTPQDVAEQLANVMLHNPQSLKAYADLPCGGGYPWTAAMRTLYALGTERLQFVIPGLIERIAQPTTGFGFETEWLSRLLFFALFDGEPKPNQQPRTPDELTHQQRTALSVLLDQRSLWRSFDFARRLQAYGLPKSRKDMATLLGRDLSPASIAEAPRARSRGSHRTSDRFELYHKRIVDLYPNLRPASYVGRVQHESGQEDDVITLNTREREAFIFRFPRVPQSIGVMRREVALLRMVRERLPVPIPDPAYSSVDIATPGQAFMGYAKLPGKPLLKEMLESVDGEETVQQLAAQIGSFLYALHQIPAADLASIGLPVLHTRERWEALYERVRQQLYPTFQPPQREAAATSFALLLSDPLFLDAQPALIHGNFGPETILYDAKARTISGIIGFTGAGLGDPALDFALLLEPHGYGEGFLARFGPVYPGLPDLLARARVYAHIRALTDQRAGSGGGPSLYSTTFPAGG